MLETLELKLPTINFGQKSSEVLRKAGRCDWMCECGVHRVEVSLFLHPHVFKISYFLFVRVLFFIVLERHWKDSTLKSSEIKLY